MRAVVARFMKMMTPCLCPVIACLHVLIAMREMLQAEANQYKQRHVVEIKFENREETRLAEAEDFHSHQEVV